MNHMDALVDRIAADFLANRSLKDLRKEKKAARARVEKLREEVRLKVALGKLDKSALKMIGE